MTVRELTAWAFTRRAYMRGRLLLAGWDIDDLDDGQVLDAVEAMWIEPLVQGAQMSLDGALDAIDEAMIAAYPNELGHRWGTLPTQQSAEASWGAPATERETPTE